MRTAAGGMGLSSPPHVNRHPYPRGVCAAAVAVAMAFASGTMAHASPAIGSAPRFGDSTWVAPIVPAGALPEDPGPRVAPPDHERRWEAVLRTPFRVAFLPLRLVAIGSEALAGRFGPGLFDPRPIRSPKQGMTVAPVGSASSIRDVALGPAITWAGFPTTDAKLKLRGTWSTFDRRTARLSQTIGEGKSVGGRLTADYDLKHNHRFYGVGNDSRRSDQSYFRLESSTLEAALLLGSSSLRQLRLIGGYSVMNPARGSYAKPLLETVFTPAGAPFAQEGTRQYTYGVGGEFARLDNPRDPSNGVHGRFDVRHDRGVRAQDPSDDRWSLEGRAYLPVFAKRRVFVTRVLYTGVSPTDDLAQAFPFYRLAQSSGVTRLAGFSAERFRDRQLALARVEYRWVVFMRMSALAQYEVGEVSPSADAFTGRSAHVSYGTGLRIGLSPQTTLRCEVARSVEGVHAFVVLGGDF
jgi:Omp85 superfamily domain